MNNRFLNTIRIASYWQKQIAVVFSLLIFVTQFSFAQTADRKILSNTVGIKLPVTFTRMDSLSVTHKYPSNNIPTEVYTNKEATVNIAFKKSNQQVSKDKVYIEGKKLENQIIKSGRVQLISTESDSKNGKHIFSFYTAALDTKVYNIMVVFAVKGKIVVGSFNCTFDQKGVWEKTAYDIVRSINPL